MKKMLIVLLLVALTVVLLIGCVSSAVAQNPNATTETTLISGFHSIYRIHDPEKEVTCYSVIFAYGAGISCLPDTDMRR
jgi:hypothetical protein